jgi:methionine-rich copper-binding protein CopC
MAKSMRTFGLALAVALGLTGQALAHAELKSAMPPVNGTVTASPSELDLEFTEGVNLAFTGVEVKGPGKKAVVTGKAALREGDDSTLVVPIAGTLRIENPACPGCQRAPPNAGGENTSTLSSNSVNWFTTSPC